MLTVHFVVSNEQLKFHHSGSAERYLNVPENDGNIFTTAFHSLLPHAHLSPRRVRFNFRLLSSRRKITLDKRHENCVRDETEWMRWHKFWHFTNNIGPVWALAVHNTLTCCVLDATKCAICGHKLTITIAAFEIQMGKKQNRKLCGHILRFPLHSPLSQFFVVLRRAKNDWFLWETRSRRSSRSSGMESA